MHALHDFMTLSFGVPVEMSKLVSISSRTMPVLRYFTTFTVDNLPTSFGENDSIP